MKGTWRADVRVAGAAPPGAKPSLDFTVRDW